MSAAKDTRSECCLHELTRDSASRGKNSLSVAQSIGVLGFVAFEEVGFEGGLVFDGEVAAVFEVEGVAELMCEVQGRLRSFRTRDNRAGEGIDLLYDCAVGERQEIIKLDAEVFVIQQKLLAGKLPAMEVEGLKARLSELLAVRKKVLEDFSRKSGDRIK